MHAYEGADLDCPLTGRHTIRWCFAVLICRLKFEELVVVY